MRDYHNQRDQSRQRDEQIKNKLRPRQAPAEYLDFRTRSVALIRDENFEPRFEVVCYGMSHRQLATVAEEDGGGAQLERRLRARGIDTDRFRANLFETSTIRDEFRDDQGRGPEPRGFLRPVVFHDDPLE